MDKKNYSRGIYYLLFVTVAIILFGIMKITSSVMIPVALAILLALIAIPVIEKLQHKFHIPWGVGILITLVFFIILIWGIGSLLMTSIRAIIAAYPKYEDRFLSVYKVIATEMGFGFDEAKGLFDNLWQQLGVKKYIQTLALTVSNFAMSFLKNFTMVLLLFTFFLTESAMFQTKISLAFQGKTRNRVKLIIFKIIRETTRFISIKFFISLITGIIVYTGLMIIGIDFPIVWGFIAFLFNFIPTFGSVISCAATILFSIVQRFPEWQPVIATGILMVSTNFFLGNIVEPRIEGDNLDISPFIILVSLSLWGWLWGFTGMILAVPLTVIIKIICENISYLRPIGIFLSNQRTLKSKQNKMKKL